MSLEILARAAELAQEGAPDAAIALLKPLLQDESFRRQAVPVMAFCYERKKDYATAAHLYLEATKLDPRHPDWPKRLQSCDAETAKAVAQAEAAPAWGIARTTLACALLILGTAAGAVAHFMPELFWVDQNVPRTFYGGIGLAALGVVLLLTSFKRALVRSARVAAARGTDYSKIPLRTCWACVLPTPAKAKRCVFCGSPRKKPKTESQDPAGMAMLPDPVSAAMARPTPIDMSSAASPSPLFPAGMPPIPQMSEEPGPPQSPANLLAGYRSTSKPKGTGIKAKLARAVGGAKKRGRAMKLVHEVKSLQTAIEAQLEALGTLTLTHHPESLDIGQQVTDLSQIQDDLSRKQETLESLRHTKGGGSVVKELNREVSQLQSRQRAVVVAIGRRALVARSEMPGTAGPYAALDRLESSLEAKQSQLKTIEDEIGPVWHTGGIGSRAMKRPLLVVGALAGGLLILLCLFWSLQVVPWPIASFGSGHRTDPQGERSRGAVSRLLGSGYQVEYKKVERAGYREEFLEVTVRGKAAKLAVILAYPNDEPWTEIIESERMITNRATVSLPIKAAVYTLTVKTFVPEKVVFEKEFGWPPSTKEVPLRPSATAAAVKKEKMPAPIQPTK